MLLVVMLLSVMLVLCRMMLLVRAGVMDQMRRHLRWSALKIDVYPARIVLGGILQSELATDLLDAGFELLDMVGRVVSFAHDATVTKNIFQLLGKRVKSKGRLKERTRANVFDLSTVRI